MVNIINALGRVGRPLAAWADAAKAWACRAFMVLTAFWVIVLTTRKLLINRLITQSGPGKTVPTSGRAETTWIDLIGTDLAGATCQ